jgi:hypothetical protein
MKRTTLTLSILATAFAASMAFAGPGGAGPGYGGGPGCMNGAPSETGCGYGPGAGMGPGYGMGGGGQGMSLLTPEERTAHMTAMHSLKTVEECNAYVAEHQNLVAERARQQGITLPVPRGNMCERMKARGFIS